MLILRASYVQFRIQMYIWDKKDKGHLFHVWLSSIFLKYIQLPIVIMCSNVKFQYSVLNLWFITNVQM